MKKFDKLIEIIATLRSENGCPWDKRQTHDSLLRFLFEETNEVADTIISQDYEHLQEELGDLLLQIVLHSQIAKENQKFTISDVINSISEKMIRRHPHIFADVEVKSEDEVNQLWEEIKKKERKNNIDKEISVLDKIPQNLPTLSRTKKIQKEVIKNGFDWPKDDFSSVIGKVKEEIEEIEDAVKNKDFKHIESEIGDLLFAAIHLAIHLDVDAETALFKCNNRFSQRFRLVELQAKDKDLKEYSINELHQFWQNAKSLLSGLPFEKAAEELKDKLDE